MFIPDATSIEDVVLVEDTSDDEVDTQVTVRELISHNHQRLPYLFHDRGQHRKASVDSGSTNRVTSPLAATPREGKDLA